MTDHKRSVRQALEKYLTKDLNEIDKINRPKKRNSSPEKDLVAKPCIAWMRSQGWDIEIFESKATYDPRAGCYRNQSMKAGTTDSMGTLPSGISIAVEFKAPGKLSTFNAPRNHKQKEFVINKIKFNSFACVVDSLELLQSIYKTWHHHKHNDANDIMARDFLLKVLP